MSIAFVSFVAITGIVIGNAGVVMALDNTGPDKSDEFGGASVSYYLANTSDVANAGSMAVPIYRSVKPANNVKIDVWCDWRPQGVKITSPLSKTICGSGGGGASDFTIDKDDFKLDPDNGFYKATLKFSLTSNTDRRGFRLTAPSNFYLGYSSDDNTDRFAIVNEDRCRQDNNRGCGEWYTYRLPFAAPCTRASGTASITLFDPDNDGSSSDGAAQYKRLMDGYVLDTTNNTKQTVNIPKSAKNGSTLKFTVSLKKGHKYKLVINDVYSNNVLQFKLPYDSINTLVSCADYDIYPSSSFADGSHMSTHEFGEQVDTVEKLVQVRDIPAVESEWGVFQFVIPQNKSMPNFAGKFNQTSYDYADADQGACGWLTATYSQISTCGVTKLTNGTNASGTDVIKGTKNFNTVPIDTSGFTYGDRVCRIVSVRHFDQDTEDSGNTSRRLSYPACVVVAKRPFVTIQGNDLRVGSALTVSSNLASKVQAATFVRGGATKGSWTEYGVFAPGNVTQMASGAALAPAGGAGTAQSAWSKLTFANSGTYGNYANASGMGVLPDIGKYFTQTTSPLITKKIVGNVTLGSYEANTVYLATGMVTINSSINAPQGTVPNLGALSQMVIIAAGGINILDTVQNIDAWLIAPNATIDTCSNVPGSLTISQCDKQLTINGAVQAKTLKLRRTAGNDTTPAETVKLRSDAYIWARKQSEAAGVYQTKQITDLPPRY